MKSTNASLAALKNQRDRTSEEWQARYAANPTYCATCQKLLPWEKRKNKFCNQSCAGKTNNKGVCRNKFGINGVDGPRFPKSCFNCKKTIRNEAKEIYPLCRTCDSAIAVYCTLCGDRAWKNSGSYCAKCLMRVRRYKQKEMAVKLKGGICDRCGRDGNICIFDFHHSGDKIDTVSNMIASNRKWITIISELNKCRMLCCICHRIVHNEESAFEKSNQHGKVIIYEGKRLSKILKECPKCGILHNYHRQHCIRCHFYLVRQNAKKKAVEYLGSVCEKCGWNVDLNGFDFHHLSNKDFTISGKINRKWDLLVIELDKCQLLCRICHRLEHEANHDCKFLDAVANYRNDCIVK